MSTNSHGEEERLNVERFLAEKAAIVDRTMEKYIPRTFSRDSTIFRISRPTFALNTVVLDKAIAEPIWDFLDRGGKRWRPSLFLLIIEALGKDMRDFLDFAIIPELVHNGTIMIDDIEDGSEFRRGRPCTHRIYGLDVAINAGNAMYYLPLMSLIKEREKISTKDLCRIYEVYATEMIRISMGQAMDIAWHRGLADADNVGEDEYLQMCVYKTGTLARMAAKIAAILGGADDMTTERLGRFAESIGVAFQIQDDVLDVTGSQFAKQKGGPGQDITEGKRSLIVIRTLKIADAKDRKRLITILNMHTSDQNLREEAMAIMRKCGSVEYARQLAEQIVRESWEEVNECLPTSDGKRKLQQFAQFLVEREI